VAERQGGGMRGGEEEQDVVSGNEFMSLHSCACPRARTRETGRSGPCGGGERGGFRETRARGEK
jgi:hypothetical protein